MFDVITIGTATRDGFFEGVNFLKTKDSRFRVGEGICLPFGSKVDVPKIYFTTGGVATNTAATFSKQGLKTIVICRVGQDVSGEEIIRGLNRDKINTNFVQIDKNIPTAYSVIFLTESGERTILSYKGAGEKLSEKEIPWRKLKAKWLFIGSLSGNEKLMKDLFSFAKKSKIKIAGNPGSRELEILKHQPDLLNNYDVFIVNQEEASYLTGISYQKEKHVFEKLDYWVNGIVVMTRGPRGSIISNGQTIWQAGIFKEKKIVDRTGAGDSFGSGFVAGLIQKRKLDDEAIEYAVRLASANATSNVECVGAKEGILGKNDFQRSSRWEKLEIKKQSLR
jgi:sugar/nucleoside kinase (ribokinase family)